MNGKKAKMLRGRSGRFPADHTEYVVGKRTDKEVLFLDGRRLTIPRLTVVLAQGCGRSIYLRLKREFKKW